MSERFPEDLSSGAEGDRSNAYRCSSMAHAHKPRVVKCLECGLSQIPKSDQPPELAELYEEVVNHDYLSNMPVKRRTFARAYQKIPAFYPNPGGCSKSGLIADCFCLRRSAAAGRPLGSSLRDGQQTLAANLRGQGARRYSGACEAGDPRSRRRSELDVIEHVPDPKRFLEEAYSLLRSGGVLAVSTIDIDSRFARMMRRHWPWIMEMHLYYFGKGVLEHMFRSAGLRCASRTLSSLRFASLYIPEAMRGASRRNQPATRLVQPHDSESDSARESRRRKAVRRSQGLGPTLNRRLFMCVRAGMPNGAPVLAGLAGLLYALSLFDLDFVLGKGPYWTQPFGDTITHLIGAMYFIRDEWRFPLFFVPQLGFPEGTNIIFMDSLPLLALGDKMASFRNRLRGAIRSGLWLFACLPLLVFFIAKATRGAWGDRCCWDEIEWFCSRWS